MTFGEAYFDAGLYRVGTQSYKWDSMGEDCAPGTIPLWVADMDFPSPPAVQEALLRRAAHPTYGYCANDPADAQAAIDFWQRRHVLSLNAEELTMLPCVVTGLKLAIRTTTAPGDTVIFLSPVYGPFAGAIKATGRVGADCPLLRDEHGRYAMDYTAIERALKAGAKALMLCNPHNPVSRPWEKSELEQLVALLRRYDAYLISDEIHADFVYAPHVFHPALTLRQEKTLSLCAASKTFNLAGLQQSLCLCKDAALREKFRQELTACGVVCGNAFALAATRAAYEQGDAWLDGLMSYLTGTRDMLTAWVHEHLPTAVLTPVEASYMAWLDLSAYGLTCEELERRTHQAGVKFTPGTNFGQGGEYHLRVNFAAPRRNVLEGLARLETALR